MTEGEQSHPQKEETCFLRFIFNLLLFGLQQRLLEERKISKHKYLHLTALLENHLFLRCHQTFVTQYESQQEEECEENFRKNCFIEYEKIAFNETVTSNQIWQDGNIAGTQFQARICREPLVKDCDRRGEEICRYQTPQTQDI